MLSVIVKPYVMLKKKSYLKNTSHGETTFRLDLTAISTTYRFCLIVYVTWPFRLASFGSSYFFNRVTHREIQDDGVIRCTRA